MSQQLPLDEYHDREYRILLSRLLQARLDTGLTQMDVAQRLGKPQSFVSRSETGARRIDIIELKAFAMIYETEISNLIEGLETR